MFLKIEDPMDRKLLSYKSALVITLCMIAVCIINICTQTIPLNFFETHPEFSSSLKFLCWNVKCSAANFSSNQEEIAKRIKAENPDIIFLCEIAMSKAPILDSIMCSTYVRNYIPGTNGIIFSKYPIGRMQEIKYEGMKRKHSLIIMADVYIGIDTVRIVGCHLASGRKEPVKAGKMRLIEADAIITELDKCTYPVILLGDMNDIAGFRTLSKLQSTGLKNAWWEKGSGYGATFHGYGLRLRIDHILYEANNLELSDVTVGETDLSDHNYMTATFNLKK